VLVEPRLTQDLIGHRALGFQSRTIEVFDQRGIAERFLAAGKTAQTTGFADVRFDLGGFPTRHPYGLSLRQEPIERILLGWVDELGVPILRGVEVTGFNESATSIDVMLSDGRSLSAQFLVGCDGGRSLIRKAAGIGFPGSDPTISHLLAEAELRDEPTAWGLRMDAIGTHALTKIEGRDGKVSMIVTEREIGGPDEPTLGELSRALVDHYGTDFGVHNPSWISRFTDMTRQAETYRRGRVLIAGDAAHIHYPAGGQGLGTGVQDAVNLGWKLAQVVKGISPDTLLDTYTAERHPVGASVLQLTQAFVALARQDDRSKALKGIVTELAALPESRKILAARMSGLDIRYDLGEGHPLLGRRMPDLDLTTATGLVRMFTLLHEARPLLINFGKPGSIVIGPWTDRVRLVEGSYTGAWELPVVGVVPAPAAVLIRPDGHVAWVGDGTDNGLSTTLSMWCGEPSAA
jgi:2-polyprenyl-6-methoxyphenol hydroxylase-like FAD-dependent oxidoreductase